MKILFDRETKLDSTLSISGHPSTSSQLPKNIDFFKRRSHAYLEFFKKLDTHLLSGTHGWDEAMTTIKEELGTAELSSLPIGLVGKCYLGHPYETHILDLSGTTILQHYKLSEAMSPEFEKARMLAKNPYYDLIEVYHDKVLALRQDGTVIKL